MAAPMLERPTSVLDALETDGIAVLPNFVAPQHLESMQRSFAAMLRRMRWNDFDGYEMTEFSRHMVQNVLTLDQGFVDAPLHPVVKEAVFSYIGPSAELVEAKGWLSLPQAQSFGGWHGDAWYDQSKITSIPRELKLAVYLTDVRSGAFNYVRGSHQKSAPRAYRDAELTSIPRDQIVEVLAPAGTAFLFDTSGIHRQATPIVEPRHAVFYTFHDPSTPLQEEDIRYYRYHPLVLNAAFLGGLEEDDQRLLGFGNKASFVPAFEREPLHEGFQRSVRKAFETKMRVDAQLFRLRHFADRFLNRRPKT
jgi:Phytanoyl-CoA dioxygenase (PhyH)